jgi:hypothetical protein
MMVQGGTHRNPGEIEDLKRLIEDENYVSDAIGRIAQVLSDEILGVRTIAFPEHHRRPETILHGMRARRRFPGALHER